MTVDELKEIFGRDDEFLRFERVKNKRNRRPDLHAFILLSELVPSDRDMISAVGHDEIFLDVSPGELAAVASLDQIIELMRCGVRYSEDDSLAMFV